MLILVCMLMQCLRNSGFDRRYMAEAAFAMRDVDEDYLILKSFTSQCIGNSQISRTRVHFFTDTFP